MTEPLLTVWVVYRCPSDHPGKWVLRAQDATRSGEVRPHPEFIVADTLDQLRKSVPPGLVCLHRHPTDDAVIYETWI
jgi:hypothetical protein